MGYDVERLWKYPKVNNKWLGSEVSIAYFQELYEAAQKKTFFAEKNLEHCLNAEIAIYRQFSDAYYLKYRKSLPSYYGGGRTQPRRLGT